MRGPRSRRTAAALACLAAIVALPACSAGAGDTAPTAAGQGYVSGDGSVRTLPPGERDDPIRFAGTTLTGERFDVRDHRGQVVVVNVWGSWCPPCIAEAPELARVADQSRADGVQFVGIDVKDNRAAALAHERRFRVTYPSIEDGTGRLLLALRGTLPPAAIPSTLVLDRRGRVAARVIGQLPEGALAGLVADALAEEGTS